MRRHKLLQRAMVGMSVLLAGGTVLGNGCMNTVASIPYCGTIFPWCTPADQLNLFYPMLETPDFSADPSCTIPLGCGGGDLFPVPALGTPGESFPGGGAPATPSDSQSGTTGGGGG